MKVTKQTESAIANMLARAASWYPKPPADLHRKVPEWTRQLRRFELKDIEDALNRVRRSSPRWFPSLGDVETACLVIVQSRAQAARNAAVRANGEHEDRLHREMLNEIPREPEEQEAWIAQAPNACERLSRQWMVEKVRQLARPTGDVYADSARRVKEIMKAIDKTGGVG